MRKKIAALALSPASARAAPPALTLAPIPAHRSILMESEKVAVATLIERANTELFERHA